MANLNWNGGWGGTTAFGYGRNMNTGAQDPKKIKSVSDGSSQNQSGDASAASAMADAVKRQQALRDQFANANGTFDMQKMIEAIRAHAAANPTPMPMPTLPVQAPMQAPPAAQWMQGPMLAPMQAALARRNVMPQG